VTLAIILNQAGASAGVAGQAREDLVTGVPVVATYSGGPFLAQQWSLIDKPPKFLPVGSAALSSAAVQSPSASGTNISPIDNPGTYLLQLLVNSGQGLGATPADVATITFYAGPTLSADPSQLPRRQMAFGERVEHNVPDGLFPGPGLNLRGWAQEWGRWYEVIKRTFVGSAIGWARVSLPGGGPAVIVNGTPLIATVTRTGVGLCTVTFSAPGLSNANFGVVGAARGGTGGSLVAFGESTSGFTIARSDPFGNQFDGDFTFAVLSQ
jgi:hypothetical protein